MALPSAHWLEVSSGLWYAAVAEVNPDAEWSSCQGLLDALQWRLADQVSETEFSQLFEAWKMSDREEEEDGEDEFEEGLQAGARLAPGGLGNGGGLEVDENSVNVSSALFCGELARRRVDEDELLLMFGLIINERNKALMRGSARGHVSSADTALDTIGMRLALAEKLFFSMDVLGRGFINLDQVLPMTLACRLGGIDCDGVSLKDSKQFGLSDVADDCVRLLQAFGCAGFYRGVVTLQRFKQVALATPDKDLFRHKLLVFLNELRNRQSGKNNGSEWSRAIVAELEDSQGKDYDDDRENEAFRAQFIALSRFLSLKGALVRWEGHSDGLVWGSRQECDHLWRAFKGKRAPRPDDEALKKGLDLVVRAFKAALVDNLSKLFPDSFICDDGGQSSVGRERSPPPPDDDVQGPKNFDNNEDEDSFEDVEELEFLDCEELEQNLTEPQVGELSPIDIVLGSPGAQLDGALLIEAFRIFEDEQSNLGIIDDDISSIAQRWQRCSASEKRSYCNRARGKHVQELRMSSAVEDFLRKTIANDHEATPEFQQAVLKAHWEPCDIDSAIEELLASHVLDLQGSSVNSDGDTFLKRESAPLSTNLGKQASILRSGRLSILSDLAAVTVLEFRLFDDGTLWSHSIAGNERETAKLDLHGAQIGTAFIDESDSPLPKYNCFVILLADRFEKPWTLFAPSPADRQGWIRDVEFAIALAARREGLLPRRRSTNQLHSANGLAKKNSSEKKPLHAKPMPFVTSAATAGLGPGSGPDIKIRSVRSSPRAASRKAVNISLDSYVPPRPSRRPPPCEDDPGQDGSFSTGDGGNLDNDEDDDEDSGQLLELEQAASVLRKVVQDGAL